jgi:hypothetical protein
MFNILYGLGFETQSLKIKITTKVPWDLETWNIWVQVVLVDLQGKGFDFDH